MGFLRVATLIVVFTGNIYCIFPPENFKFNCIYDICTFPIQYCDLKDQRCHYCNDDVCRSDKVPEQCRYRCEGLQTSTPQTTEKSEVLPKSSGQSSSSCPDLNDVINFIVVIAIIAAVALILVVCTIVYCVCCKKQLLDKIITKHTKDSLNNQEVTTPLIKNQDQVLAMEAGMDGNNDTGVQQPKQNIVNMEAGSGHNGGNSMQHQSSNNGNGSPTSNKVSHPDPDDSEGRHENINEVDMLNFQVSSSYRTDSQTYTVQNQHGDEGRHNNVNDNNFLDSNLGKKVFDNSRTNDRITTPTDRGNCYQIENDKLDHHQNGDSGVNLSGSDDSLTIAKNQMVPV